MILDAANSIVRLLSDLGALHLVEGRNAISFCNVLVVGNCCACVTLIVIYYRQWPRVKFRALSRTYWVSQTPANLNVTDRYPARAAEPGPAAQAVNSRSSRVPDQA